MATDTRVPAQGYFIPPKVKPTREEQLEAVITAWIEAYETLQENFQHMPRTLALIEGRLDMVAKVAKQQLGRKA